MIYLLDTNVLSEQRKRDPDPRVSAWLDEMRPGDLRLSVITIGELRRGVRKLELRGDHRQAALYRAWADETRRLFVDRIAGVDVTIAEAWGRLAAARPMSTPDALIGATAECNDWTLVTRHVKDFEHLGVRLLNPFSD